MNWGFLKRRTIVPYDGSISIPLATLPDITGDYPVTETLPIQVSAERRIREAFNNFEDNYLHGTNPEDSRLKRRINCLCDNVVRAVLREMKTTNDNPA